MSKPMIGKACGPGSLRPERPGLENYEWQDMQGMSKPMKGKACGPVSLRPERAGLEN